MSGFQDLSGQKFGRWTVVSRTEHRGGNARWNCICDCGGKGEVLSNKLKSGWSTSCGCRGAERLKSMKGEKHPQWKGGRSLRNTGYVFVRLPNHPAQQNAYVQEHRVVMEAKLGRYLQPYENVHHLNGVRSDNRIENLELWCKKQPYGQRVEDLVQFALEILQQYAPNELAVTKTVTLT